VITKEQLPEVTKMGFFFLIFFLTSLRNSCHVRQHFPSTLSILGTNFYYTKIYCQEVIAQRHFELILTKIFIFGIIKYAQEGEGEKGEENPPDRGAWAPRSRGSTCRVDPPQRSFRQLIPLPLFFHFNPQNFAD